jgi:PST family polysaccharide transporter
MRLSIGAPSPDAELATDHLTHDLGRRSRRGGAVLLSAQMVRVLAQMATLVVLARLLPPSAFGLLAMVAAIGAVLDLVKEFGLSAATIQKQNISHAQVSALFWINAGVGAALSLGLFLAAPLLARFYGQPELEAVARWLALAFAASGLTVQHWALLRRQMRFGAIAGLETTADLLSFGTAIGLAVAGVGYWALVAQRLVSPILLMLGSWALCRWRPARPARTAGVSGLLGFGASVTGSGLAVAFSRSIDQILIGWLWGPALLGLYERTTRLLLMPINTINAPVYAAAMPALSRLTDQPARYRSMFGQVMQKLALLTMPAFALAAVTADWVVQILLGPSWVEAVPLVALPAGAFGGRPALHDAGPHRGDAAGYPDRRLALRGVDPGRPALGCRRHRRVARRHGAVGPHAVRLLAGHAPRSGFGRICLAGGGAASVGCSHGRACDRLPATLRAGADIGGTRGHGGDRPVDCEPGSVCVA